VLAIVDDAHPRPGVGRRLGLRRSPPAGRARAMLFAIREGEPSSFTIDGSPTSDLDRLTTMRRPCSSTTTAAPRTGSAVTRTRAGPGNRARPAGAQAAQPGAGRDIGSREPSVGPAASSHGPSGAASAGPRRVTDRPDTRGRVRRR
jgi:hypothetical protein